jgi:hypothetical protein
MKPIEQEDKNLRVWLSWAEFTLLLSLTSQASAQQPVETASVCGCFSGGDGIWRAEISGWFYYDYLRGFELNESVRRVEVSPIGGKLLSKLN